jgi:FMN-dependent NADH-azoreductase
MMTILHVSCSPRGPASESYRISQKIIEFLLKREPTAMLVNRVIGDGATSHIDESYATALGATQQSFAEIFPEWSMSRSEELIRELESADFVVIGTPMHNFTVPSALKAWIDHIVRVRRTFDSTKEEPCRQVTRPPSLCRRVLGREILREARASARFSYSVSKSQSGHHRTA